MEQQRTGIMAMCGLVALVTGMGKANCTQVHLVKWQTVILIVMMVMFYIY